MIDKWLLAFYSQHGSGEGMLMLGIILKLLRTTSGDSLETIASVVDKPVEQVRRWEDEAGGTDEISAVSLYYLALHYGLSLDHLFDFVDKKIEQTWHDLLEETMELVEAYFSIHNTELRLALLSQTQQAGALAHTPAGEVLRNIEQQKDYYSQSKEEKRKRRRVTVKQTMPAYAPA